MAQKRINHNDLIPWFTRDHKELPASYLKSCRKFFEELGIKAASNKLQAEKLQAASGKRCNLFTTMLNKKTERENKK